MTTNKIEVTKLYIATFNRAPDAIGLNYWMNKIADEGWTLSMIAQSFFDQPEAQALYPSNISTAEFVTSVYNNVLQREPDADGLNYWINNIDSGFLDRHDLITAVINAVNTGNSQSDLMLLTNRVEVGTAFADIGLNDVDQAREVLSEVTAEILSLRDAINLVESYAANYSPSVDPVTMDLFGAGGRLRLDFSDAGTQGDDVINIELLDYGLYNLVRTAKVVQTLDGDDSILVSSMDENSTAVLLGGSGDDTYQISNGGAYIIYDAAGDDKLVLDVSMSDLTSTTFAGGRDLVLRSGDLGIVLPDWQNPDHRIETIQLTDATYRYEDLFNEVEQNAIVDVPSSLVDPDSYTIVLPSGTEMTHFDLFVQVGELDMSLEEIIAPVPLLGMVNADVLADYLI